MSSIVRRLQICVQVRAVSALVLCAAIGSMIGAYAPAHAQSPASAELPLVVVLSTGGTIAGRGGSTTSLSEYKAGSIPGSELVDAVPEIKSYARVRVEQ